MARHLLVCALLSLCAVVCTQAQATWPRPTTTMSSGSQGYMCYVCDSEADEGDHCSADWFDPYSQQAIVAYNCKACKKFVGMEEGRTVTRRSCVYNWDTCDFDAETDCCEYDHCNGRMWMTAGGSTLRAVGVLSILPVAAISAFKLI